MDRPDPTVPGQPALTVVFRAQSDIEASIVRGLLEAHGIFAALSSDLTHAVFPLTIDGLGEVRVSVPTSQARDARAIIEQQSAPQPGGQVVRMPEGRDFSAFEERIGHRFNDAGMIERAMTHRSLAHEDTTGATPDNESLEFLGDAVLGFVMADLLYREFPQLDEGQKSKIKAALVSTATLAQLARELGLGSYLALARGEEKTGGRNKPALLADGYEALIAALYLDGGIEAARAFILREFDSRLEDVRSPEFWGRDYKSVLQEVVQARGLPLPEYTVADEAGPDHRKVFHVDVKVDGELMGTAHGATKKAAEQAAARQALEQLG